MLLVRALASRAPAERSAAQPTSVATYPAGVRRVESAHGGRGPTGGGSTGRGSGIGRGTIGGGPGVRRVGAVVVVVDVVAGPARVPAPSTSTRICHADSAPVAASTACPAAATPAAGAGERIDAG